MSLNSTRTIEQRINDWKAFCVKNRIKYKDVILAAGLDHNSVKNNMGINRISHKRMTLLEETAIHVCSERKLETKTQ